MVGIHESDQPEFAPFRVRAIRFEERGGRRAVDAETSQQGLVLRVIRRDIGAHDNKSGECGLNGGDVKGVGIHFLAGDTPVG